MNAIDRISSQRDDLAGFLGDIARLEAIFESWDETPHAATQAYRRALESINGEALRRLVRALKTDPAALAAMKAALADEVVYAVMRRHDIVKPTVTERVDIALEGVRPMLASHGGDVELVKVAPPSIEVRFTGACDGCPASAMTFHAGVKKAVEAACPEITEILQIKGHGGAGEGSTARFVSPFAIETDGDWLFAGSLSDVPEGGILAMKIGTEKVILSRRGAMVTCFQNACAHLGMRIDEGPVADGIITCPHHGFQYDLSTGECLTAPSVQLQPHAVRVLGRRIEVRLAS